MSTQLKKVTIYLTAEEYARMKAAAEDEGVTVSAIVRAEPGLSYKRRGAPEGNLNRQKKAHGKKRSTKSR